MPIPHNIVMDMNNVICRLPMNLLIFGKKTADSLQCSKYNNNNNIEIVACWLNYLRCESSKSVQDECGLNPLGDMDERG